jgi:hypothetical protein
MNKKDKMRIALSASVIMFVLSRCFDGVLALVLALVATVLVASVIIYDLVTEKNKKKFVDHMWFKFFLFFLFISPLLSGWALLTSAVLAAILGAIVFFRLMVKFTELSQGNAEENLNKMK